MSARLRYDLDASTSRSSCARQDDELGNEGLADAEAIRRSSQRPVSEAKQFAWVPFAPGAQWPEQGSCGFALAGRPPEWAKGHGGVAPDNTHAGVSGV